MLWCSQVAPGNENALKLGSTAKRAGWNGPRKTRTISGTHRWANPSRLLTRNGAGATAAGQRVSRIPGGHPEGYLEGFATIYNEAAEAIIAHRDGKPAPEGVIFPGIEDGLAGRRLRHRLRRILKTRRRMAQVRKLQQALTHGK
jgi:hypothetical protein